ncbi:MAG TPA: capsid protein VP2 [Candidatus Desulfofervidus auxilii]|uniref:Capsid protein VP2 n=1 Tax=Desulfofervidus auxilii TaxID=1621989 RepID=A0A7C0Y562_DESA2|nr:capsid protein VP2 [Candidatus Desulfofervidus auxilii]
MAKNKEKWIQSAIKHPGALRKQLKVKKGKKIPLSKLKKAAKKGGVLGRRARLAITLRKLAAKRKKKK